jgi:predicted transglutaminase-like cysteine proteinase
VLQLLLRRFGAVSLCFGLLACSAGPARQATSTAPSATTRFATPYDRWLAVATRFDAQRAAPDLTCGDDPTCPAAQWATLVNELKPLSPRDRLLRANAALNAVRYVTAQQNWGDPGYWETPYQFLARGGQCQDYAIAKYFALAESGFPTDALHILVVRDTLRALDHAILVADIDSERLVLDNQTPDVVDESTALLRYAPYYAIEAHGWQNYLAARPQVAGQAHFNTGGFTLAHYY